METEVDSSSRTSGGTASSSRNAVLLPTGRKMKSYGCMRSLHRRGVHVVVASEYDHVPHFDSRYCSERVRLASSPEDLLAYKDELLSLARRDDVETIVPIRECDAFLLAKYRAEFAEEVSLVTPTLDVLERAHDRLRLAEEAERAGVPVASTQLLSDVEAWNRNAVIKSRYNVLTDDYVESCPPGTAREVKDVRFLRPGEEPDVGAVRAKMGHEPIVQEFVPQAKKHLYCALWDHGEPLATYQHRQIRQNSWVGGGGVYRESVHSEAVERVAAKLLRRLDWHGLACIEYVEDARSGEWTFLEINPRVWQSMPEAVRAGADFPYYYWLRAREAEDHIDDGYDDGIHCHCSYGEIAHLRSIRHDESPYEDPPSFGKTLFDVATSCLRHPRFDYARLDDPGLFLSALRDAMGAGVTSSRAYSSGDGAGAPIPESEDPRA